MTAILISNDTDDTATVDTRPVDEAGNVLLTTREMAEIFGTTPRALRRRFRAAGVGCGQGSFYASTVDEVQAVLDRINASS